MYDVILLFTVCHYEMAVTLLKTHHTENETYSFFTEQT